MSAGAESSPVATGGGMACAAVCVRVTFLLFVELPNVQLTCYTAPATVLTSPALTMSTARALGALTTIASATRGITSQGNVPASPISGV